jgi:heat shock protein HslJ
MKPAIIRNTALAAVIALLIGGGMISTGCSSDNDPDAALYTIWQLQEFILDDGTTVPVDEPANYTLELRTDGTAAIRADCNNCSGSFNADEDTLTFGLMACTLAACPEGSFESQYRMALGTASGYELTPQLLLDYDGGVMRFIPAPTLF